MAKQPTKRIIKDARTEQFFTQSGFSEICKGTYCGERVAVKQSEYIKLPSEEDTLVLTNLPHHRNVVRFYDVEEVMKDNRPFSRFALELCDPNKTMAHVFLPYESTLQYRGQFNADDAVIQLADGLRHLHSQGVVHGNIKPTNVFIVGAAPTEDFKWSDFGVSKYVTDERIFSTEEPNEHPGLTSATCFSPEMLQWRLDPSNKGDTWPGTKKSDVFVAGCLFFRVLVEGHHNPFGDEYQQINRNIMGANPVHLKRLSSTHFARDIILQMISNDPAARPDMEEVFTQLSIKKVTSELLPICSMSNPSDADVQRLRQLLDGTDPSVNFINCIDENEMTPFQLLCRRNSSRNLKPCLELLLEKGMQCRTPLDVNYVNPKDGFTGVLYLCRENYHHENLIDILNLLIAHEVNLNVQEKDQFYGILHYLFRPRVNCVDRKDLLQIVQLLISEGLNANLKYENKDNSLGFLKLHFIKDFEQRQRIEEIKQLLIDSGAEKLTVLSTKFYEC